MVDAAAGGTMTRRDVGHPERAFGGPVPRRSTAVNSGRPLIELYKELAARFPHGLADEEALPEEVSGFVQRASAKRSEVTYVAVGV